MITVKDSLQTLRSPDIRDLIGGFSVKYGQGPKWEFPDSPAGDGCVGALCVSKCIKEPVAGASDELAVHLTFQIPQVTIPSKTTVGRDGQIRVAIRLENLHFTARPTGSQNTISSVGASSILQAQVSTHRGTSNDWMHRDKNPDRLVSLANALGLSAGSDQERAQAKQSIDDALGAYDRDTLVRLGSRITGTIEEQIKSRLNVPNDLAVKPVVVDLTTTNW